MLCSVDLIVRPTVISLVGLACWLILKRTTDLVWLCVVFVVLLGTVSRRLLMLCLMRMIGRTMVRMRVFRLVTVTSIELTRKVSLLAMILIMARG